MHNSLNDPWGRFVNNYKIYQRKEDVDKKSISEKKRDLTAQYTNLQILYKETIYHTEDISKQEKSVLNVRKEISDVKVAKMRNRNFMLLLTIQACFLRFHLGHTQFPSFTGDLEKLYNEGSQYFEKSIQNSPEYFETKKQNFLSYLNQIKELNNLLNDFSDERLNQERSVPFKNGQVPLTIKRLVDEGINFKNLNHPTILQWNKAIADCKQGNIIKVQANIQLKEAKINFFLLLLKEYNALFASRDINLEKILLTIVSETSLKDITEVPSEFYPPEFNRDVARLFKLSSYVDIEIMDLCGSLQKKSLITMKLIHEIIYKVCRDRQKAFLWNHTFINRWQQLSQNEIDFEDSKRDDFVLWMPLRKRSDLLKDDHTRRIFEPLTNVPPQCSITNLMALKFIYGTGLELINQKNITSVRIYSHNKTALETKYEKAMTLIDLHTESVKAFLEKKSTDPFARVTLSQSQWEILRGIAKEFNNLLTSINTEEHQPDIDTTTSNLKECFNKLREKISLYHNVPGKTKKQKELLVNMADIYVRGQLEIDNYHLTNTNTDLDYYLIKNNASFCGKEIRIPMEMYWGSLINDEPTWWKTFQQILGSDFQSQLKNIQKEIITLMSINKPTENSPEAHRVTTLCLSEYQIVLNRILDIISTKQRDLIRNHSPNDPMTIILQNEVDVLNQAYDHYLTLHQSLKAPPTTIWWKCVESLVFSSFTSFNINYLWGFSFFKYIPSSEFEFKKLCADKGFNFVEDMKEFLGFLFENDGTEQESVLSVISNIKSRAQAIYNFSNRHPEITESILGDLYVSVLPFLDQDDIKSLTTLTGIHQFYKVLKPSFVNRYEKKEVSAEDLKLIALSQLAKSLPTVSAVLKTVVSIVQGKFEPSLACALSIPLDAVKNLGRVKFFQSVSDLSTEAPEIVTDLIHVFGEVVQGTDFHTIMEGQTRKAVAKAAVEVWHAFQNPQKFRVAIKREFSIWWRSLLHPQSYNEWVCRVVVQIICPVATLMAARGVFVAVMSASMGVWVALPLFIGITVLGLSISFKAYSLINFFSSMAAEQAGIGTREQIETKLFHEAGRVEAVCKRQIKLQAAEHINQLKKKNSLPDVETNIPEKVRNSLRPNVNKWVEKIEQEMSENEVITVFENPKDYCLFFAKHVKQEKLRERIQKEEGLRDELLYQAAALVTAEIEKKWLKNRVEKSLYAKMKSDLKAPSIGPDLVQRKVEESYPLEYREAIKDPNKMRDFFVGRVKERTNASDKEIDHSWMGYLKTCQV